MTSDWSLVERPLLKCLLSIMCGLEVLSVCVRLPVISEIWGEEEDDKVLPIL